MFTTIVVGTDGSDSAASAVRQAAELAQLAGGTLHIVHAYQAMNMSTLALSASGGGGSIDVTGVNEGIAANAQTICERSGAIVDASVACETHAVPGDPCEALISTAEQVGADLIVVGNRGMTGVKRFVLGSVPNKISHHAPCSVLIADTSH